MPRNESDAPRFSLSRFSAVALQQSTKSLYATNLRNRYQNRSRRLRIGLGSLLEFRTNDQFVIQPLMRPLLVIVFLELFAKNVHVPVTKDDEVIEAFLLDRLDKSLGKGDHVRRANRCSLCLDLALFQRCQERFRVFTIVVVHQDFATRSIGLGRCNKCFGLRNHPLLIGLVRRRGNVDAAGLDVNNKDQDEDISKSAPRNDLLREEVTLPQRFGMSSDEFVPSTRSTVWTDIVSISFEYCFDRISRDRHDAEFPQFTEDSSVAPAVILREFEDQFFDIRFSPASSSLLRFDFLLSRFVRLSNPLSQRIRMNDRTKMVECRTKTTTESNQPILFPISQRQPIGQSRAKQLVFGLEKADVASKFFVGSLRKNEQKCGVDVTKVGHRLKSYRSMKMLGGRSFCTPEVGSRVVDRGCRSMVRKPLTSNRSIIKCFSTDEVLGLNTFC